MGEPHAGEYPVAESLSIAMWTEMLIYLLSYLQFLHLLQ